MHNSIIVITCEKCCLNHHHMIIHFPYTKKYFPTIAVTFYKIQQPLHSSNMQPANASSPATSWLVKCVIHHVRNFKCVFLKRLLLCQLSSRQFLLWKDLKDLKRVWLVAIATIVSETFKIYFLFMSAIAHN